MRAFLLLIVVNLIAATTFACSVWREPHQIDSDERKVDHMSPSAPEAKVARIGRGSGPTIDSDGTVHISTCAKYGWVTLELTTPPSDDRTPVNKLGYRVVHVAGALPPDTAIGRVYRLANPVTFDWIDGATDEHGPIDFTVAIIVVDLAGNESAPSAPVRIYDPGNTRPPN